MPDAPAERPAMNAAPASSLWIRNAWWDSFWILSGFPLGVALLLLSPSVFLTLALVILLEHAHFLSPMTLAWTHADFRALMLRRPMKFIGVPLLIIATTTTIGILTSLYVDLKVDIGLKVRVYDFADYKQPFVMIVTLYWLWNGWHFAMQKFGVLSIYRAKSGSGSRLTDRIYCLGIQILSSIMVFARILDLDPLVMRQVFGAVAVLGVTAMLMREKRASPRMLFMLADAAGLMLFLWSGLWGFAIWSVNHWLVAIGLSSHVYAMHRRRSALPFIAGLLAAGILVFWVIFGSGVNLDTIFNPKFVVSATMIAMGVRYGVAFTHFLYDRWLWQFSNPDVRATVGKDVFTTSWALQDQRAPVARQNAPAR